MPKIQHTDATRRVTGKDRYHLNIAIDRVQYQRYAKQAKIKGFTPAELIRIALTEYAEKNLPNN